jgi:hypothetical protein
MQHRDGAPEPRKLNRWERFIGVDSELHRQIYRMPRDYPQAFWHTVAVCSLTGFFLGALFAITLGA